MIRRLVTAASAAVASFVFAGSLAAQTGVLSGVIYDQTNKTGLAGAEVRIKGTDLVAVSGKDGRFTIANVPAGAQEIETVRSGYRPFRLPSVKIAGADTAHVYLALSAMPEERVGAAVDDRAAAEERMIVEKEMAARGELLGRIVLKADTMMTALGAISADAPLYIVDGVLMSSSAIPLKLDPSAIASVEVIKGTAAESLYGSKAANGVIKITTKPKPD